MPEIDQSTTEQPTVEVPVGSNGHGDAGSLMATLRARREALAAERRLELEIPGYAGLLVARYKPIEWEEASAISSKVIDSDDPRADLLGAADLLIACCEEMLTRNGDKLVPLSEGPELEQSVRDVLGNQPVRYEERLAKAFGFEAEKARAVVLDLFRNDFAVIDQHREVLAWLRNANPQVDEDF